MARPTKTGAAVYPLLIGLVHPLGKLLRNVGKHAGQRSTMPATYFSSLRSPIVWPLRRLALAVAASLVVIGILLVGVLAYAGWQMNAASLQAQQGLVANAIDQTVTRTLDEQKSVAWWDEPARRIRPDRIDKDWLDVEFGSYLTEAYGHDEIYIVGSIDQPVYAYLNGARSRVATAGRRATQIGAVMAQVRGRQQRVPLSRDARFASLQKRYVALEGARAGRWAANLLQVDGRPAVISAITIVPTVEEELRLPAPYVLVSVKYLDKPTIEAIGASLLLPGLELHRPGTEPAKVGVKHLVGDDGTPIGQLTWNAVQPGRLLLHMVLPFATLAVFAFAIFTSALARRLVRASAELASREADARHQALHDPLSGLPNRRAFGEAVARDLQRKRPGRGPLVAYLDVDRFKDINDSLGHRAGDELVAQIGLRLRKAVPQTCFLARLGGDEFAILLPDDSITDPHGLGLTLMDTFQRPFELDEQEIVVSASVGIAWAPDHGHSAEELLRHADIALYKAKADGRGHHVLFKQQMADSLEDRMELENELRTAIAEDGLSVAYQPIVSAAADDIIAVEVLARWEHPTRGSIPPSTFIPIAEAAGIMPSLGSWILERGIADAARWPQLQISINLSPAQIKSENISKRLRDLVQAYAVDPARIVLEITETVLLDSSEHVATTLAMLGEAGFKLALDDFGTGYSSLSYLRDYKFDKLKIDRSFVSGVTHKREAMTIVQAVVALGRGLGMEVVAEGVESEAEVSLMRMAGCTELQGFHISRPLNEQAITNLLSVPRLSHYRRLAGRT